MDIAGFEKIAKYLAVPLVLVGFALMLVFGIHDKLIASGLLTQVSAGDSSEIIKLILRYGFQLGLCVTVLGFALAGWSKYMDKVQPVDAAKLALKLLGPQLEAKDEQIKALTEAITALSKTGAPAASINDALQELERGDTAKAQAIFAEVAATNQAAGQQHNQKAAEAYRHLGALAYMNDTKAALAAYQKAVELDPDNTEGWNELGQLLCRLGDLAYAEKAFRKVLALGEVHQDKEERAWALGNLGIVYGTRGELDKAEEMHRKAMELNEALRSKEGMASNYGNLGNIAYLHGELDKAEDIYKKSLEISETFGLKEVTANQYSNLGKVYKKRGNLAQAKAAWQKSLNLFQEMGAMQHPDAKKVQQWLDELAQRKAGGSR